MKKIKNNCIIGIDHGYGNIKTANHIFRTGVAAYDREPQLSTSVLAFGGRYFNIGEGHKEFTPDKQTDDDYYVLTLAAMAMELADEGVTEANVIIAAGLPLTWTGDQMATFAAYLTKNEYVAFTFQRVNYKLHILGARVYPQGYAAVADFAGAMDGVNMIADVGNGTMNILTVINGVPQMDRMFTEQFGVYQCVLRVREAFMRKKHRRIDDAIIDEVLITGTANISSGDLEIITDAAQGYVDELFRHLREHGYDESTMTLYITGGGYCLVRNFGCFDPERVVLIEDICAAAKGYEYLAELQLRSE